MGPESSANCPRLLWLQAVMNARVVVGVVGAVTLLLGLVGLFRPEWAMNFLGYAVASNPIVSSPYKNCLTSGIAAIDNKGLTGSERCEVRTER